MTTFSIGWSTTDGCFGFTTVEDCLSIDDAFSEFDAARHRGEVPLLADIDRIGPISTDNA